MAKTQIQLLAHATFKVTTPEGRVVVVDPWFTDNPFLRKEDREQERIDLILVTHGHEDHFDAQLPAILARSNAKVAANNVCRYYLLEQGVPDHHFEPMNMGGTIHLLDLSVTMVMANHVSHIRTADGKIGYMHESVGFVLHLSDGTRIYFAGDTGLFGDMRLIADLYQPNVAVLPIGDRYTMGPLEAAHAIRLLNVKQVIPCHYGTFPALVGRPETLIELTQDLPDLQIHVLKRGDHWTAP